MRTDGSILHSAVLTCHADDDDVLLLLRTLS